jgi:hypothetical protein
MLRWLKRIDDLTHPSVKAPAPQATDAVGERGGDQVVHEAESLLVRPPAKTADFRNDLRSLRLLEGVEQRVLVEVARAAQRLEVELAPDHRS